MKRIIFVLLLSVISTTAWATDVFTAQFVENTWQSYQRSQMNVGYAGDTMYEGYYMGIVCGVARTGDGSMWQLPVGTTNAQLFAIVGRFLDAHPELWSESDVGVISLALYKAFGKIPVKRQGY